MEDIPERRELEKSLPNSVRAMLCSEQTQRHTAKTMRNDLALDHHPQKARQNVQPGPSQIDDLRKTKQNKQKSIFSGRRPSISQQIFQMLRTYTRTTPVITDVNHHTDNPNIKEGSERPDQSRPVRNDNITFALQYSLISKNGNAFPQEELLHPDMRLPGISQLQPECQCLYTRHSMKTYSPPSGSL